MKQIWIDEIIIFKSPTQSFPAKIIKVDGDYLIVRPLSYINHDFNPSKDVKVNSQRIDFIRPQKGKNDPKGT